MRSGALASCALSQHGLTWVLSVEGDADHACVEIVENAAKTAGLEQSGILTVDLTGATLVDTSFIRWLVGLKRRLERRDASLIVIVPAGPVHEVFTITGMAEELTVVEDGVSVPDHPAPG
jgi:anti-anti-sigma factor